jgi:hypothetical protein
VAAVAWLTARARLFARIVLCDDALVSRVLAEPRADVQAELAEGQSPGRKS